MSYQAIENYGIIGDTTDVAYSLAAVLMDVLT
jgi:hypothetical protein